MNLLCRDYLAHDRGQRRPKASDVSFELKGRGVDIKSSKEFPWYVNEITFSWRS